MRTLNVRLAVILLMIVIVGGPAVYFIHFFQQKRNAYFFLEQAETAKQEAEAAHKDNKPDEEVKALEKQLRNMEWYLSFQPNDLDVMENLGILQANEGIFLPAYGYLDKVVREDYTRNKARRKLIDLVIMGRRFSDAFEHINYLLKETPDDPELLQLLGQCEEATDEVEKARNSYEKAIEYAPNQLETYLRLANLLRKRLEKPKEADDWMQKLVKNNANSAKAYIYLGNYLQTIDSREEAMTAAEKGLELSPDDTDGLLLATSCAMELGDLEKARKYAEHNIEVHKDSPQIYIILADIMLRSKDREKAIEILDRGLKETSNAPQILWTKASLLVDDKKLDEAKDAIDKLQGTSYPKPLIDFLFGKISFAQKDWAEASRIFERIRPALAAVYPSRLPQVDSYLGYCYGQLHNVDQQIGAYQRVLAIDPFNSIARQGLTEAMLASGRIDDAAQEYNKLIRLGKMPPGGLINFASILIRQNMQLSPDDQKWDQVEKVLDEADKSNPDNFKIILLRSEVLHAQNRDQEAEKLIQKAHEKNPQQVEFWNAMVAIAALQKKWDQAEKILNDYEKQVGDSVDLRLTRTEYLLRRYKNKTGEHLAKLDEKIDAFSDADKIKLWNGLLNAARRSDSGELTKKYVDLLSHKDTNNLEILFLRLEQAANKQDPAALEETLKDIERVEGKGPTWLFGQARLLAVKASNGGSPSLLEEALQNLLQARESRPSWARIPLFMGTIYDQQKKPDPALKYYLEAIGLGEHGPVVVRRTVQLLFRKQRYADAEKLLSNLDRQQAPFTPELTRMWVESLIQKGEFDTAVTKARQAVSEKSDVYGEHLWLGQILGIASRRAKEQKRTKDFQDFSAEAEKSLRRAVELKGDTAETWVTLVHFLASVDKIPQAEDVIDQARGKIPPEQAPIALAECYEAVEKNDKALEQYKLALAAKPDDPVVVRSVADFYQRIGKTVEAEALLRMVIEGKVKEDEANLLWARRQLAVITAAKGGLLNAEAARKLIEENLAAVDNSVNDLRIKAIFDAQDPRRSRKEEAINTMTKLMEGQQATPEDRFNLAVLYLSTERQQQSHASSTAKTSAGDNKKDSSAWINASNILRNLITSQSNEPRYLALYAHALLDHEELTGAELYLNKLNKDFPKFAPTITLQAELLVRHNQYEEALDLLKSFVNMKDAVPTDRSKRILAMAEVMEQLSERLKNSDQKTMADRYIRTAEMFYRQYIDEHPSQALDLVMFFIKQGQYEDAVNILDQTWQNSDPLSTAQVCMRLIQDAKSSKDISQRVEKVLSDARTTFQNHPAIVLTLGDIRVAQNRYPEAEKFYREVLEKTPGHSLALNNLSMVLSLQGKNLDEALSLINKAIELSGPLASMLDTRACVYIAQGNAEKALSDMEEAVADNPSPPRLFHQAQALSLGNQKYAASSTMQRALKAGLTKEMLEFGEIPAFEKLEKLAKELGTTEEVRK